MPFRTSSLAGILVDEWTTDDGRTRHFAERVYFDTPQWEATLEWCRFHGIDPYMIPAGTEIVRNAQAHTIRYTACVRGTDRRWQRDNDGSVVRRAMVVQGEAGPLPFPEVA